MILLTIELTKRKVTNPTEVLPVIAMVYFADPPSPAYGEIWLVKNSYAGQLMGALGMTTVGEYTLCTQTIDGIRRVNLL